MSIMDNLYHIFKSANPDASDEDIQNQVASLNTSPDQLSSVMGPLGGDLHPASMYDKAPSPDVKGTPNMDLSIPDVNSVKSNFDVNSSTDTTKMGGQPESLSTLPDKTPEPSVSAAGSLDGVKPTEVPPTAKPSVETGMTTPKAGKSELTDLMKSPSTSNADQTLLDEQRRKHNLGIIPVAAAGIGDAISNAASAYGAKGTSGTQEKVAEGIDKSIDKDKAQFEDREKKDPNSDISKHYQKVLGLMLGDHAKDMDVSKMSAEHIAATLPQVEKYMQKELGLKQIAATKDMSNNLALGKSRDQRFRQLGDALDPSKQRQGAFGVSKQVYDRAERLESLASAFSDGNLDSRQVEELAIGLNAMLSGANVGAQAQVRALVPHSAWGNTQKMAEFLTNNPRGMQQQEFVKRMLGSISREKSTAEDQMNRTRFSRIAPYQDLEKEDPATFGDVLQSQGVDPAKWKAWKDSGFKSMSAVQSPDTAQLNKGAVPVVTSQDQYNRLPSGASYQDANGKTYRKK